MQSPQSCRLSPLQANALTAGASLAAQRKKSAGSWRITNLNNTLVLPHLQVAQAAEAKARRSLTALEATLQRQQVPSSPASA